MHFILDYFYCPNYGKSAVQLGLITSYSHHIWGLQNVSPDCVPSLLLPSRAFYSSSVPPTVPAKVPPYMQMQTINCTILPERSQTASPIIPKPDISKERI